MNEIQYEDLHDYLEELIADKETEYVEFKHGKGGFPSNPFWESYSSFANTEGGVIVIGVKEKNGIFKPEGLTREQIDEYEKIFWDGANNPLIISQNLLTNKDIVKGEYLGSHIIMFFVPRASRENRPIYKGQNPLRGTYRRDASGDYLCKEREVAIMLSEQSPSLAQDFDILDGFTIEDIDEDSFRGFRQLFASLRPSHVWATDDDLSLLKHIKAYRKDRKTGKEGLTLSGLLMFGKNDSIMDALPHYMIDYREYTPGSERWSDRIYNDGTWEANLFQAYRRILPKLQSSLPMPFKIKGNNRLDETKAHVALREAFVNFCVHASYQSDSKLTILKYPNEIVFSNPGTMLVSKEQYYSGGYTVCRNPSLQTMFSLIGAAEKAGSGSDTIVRGWKEAQYRLPVIAEKSDPNMVELVLPLESVMSDKIKAELFELFGDRINSLDANRLKVLAMALSMGNITNSLLQHSIELHRSDITALLRALCKDGYLISQGFGRGTNYILNKSVGKLGGLFSNSSNDGESYGESYGESTDRLREGQVRRKRLSYSELSAEIAAICDTWKSCSEIARILCYKSNYISTRLLPRMLSEGLIESLHKDSPKHPGQKYRAIKNGSKSK